jgi:phage baseplate assembly protein gpV
MAASVLGALGAPVFLASAAAAATAQPAPVPSPAKSAAADVKLAYDSPQVSADGEHLVWRWTLTNEGSGAAGGVVLVHRLTPALKISHLAKECRAIASGVSCSYGTIKAGQRKAGSLEAELSRDVSGTVEINGRVTWQQGAAGPGGSDTEGGQAPAQPGQVPGQPGQVPGQPGQVPGGQLGQPPGGQPGEAPAQPGQAPAKPAHPGQAQGQTGQGAYAAPAVKRPVRTSH